MKWWTFEAADWIENQMLTFPEIRLEIPIDFQLVIAIQWQQSDAESYWLWLCIFLYNFSSIFVNWPFCLGYNFSLSSFFLCVNFWILICKITGNFLTQKHEGKKISVNSRFFLVFMRNALIWPAFIVLWSGRFVSA